MKTDPHKYTITSGEVWEFASTLKEARKKRTWMAKGIGLPSGELWIQNTDTGSTVVGRWQDSKK